MTFHIFFLLQLTFASFTALTHYTLSNKIDAINITLALFILIGVAFFIASLWYITGISKFDGSQEEMSSKAATRQTVEKESSSNTEQNDSNIVINLSSVKEMNRFETNEFNNTTSFQLTTSVLLNGTRSSGFTNGNRQNTEESEEEMGEEESFLPFDYCYLYNNANKNAKYFLPMLVIKLFGFALFSSTLTAYPFYMMVLHLVLSIVFLIFVCCAKPFQSKLTQARIIVTELLLIAIQCAFTLYQFYAQKLIYLNSIEFYLILAVIVLLSVAIVFTLIEQYRIWKDSLSSLCEGCCLYFRLKGNSKKV